MSFVQVLRWFGFFKEAVTESPTENHRVRKVVVLFYLEDNSCQVVEPKEDNSGLPQVTLLCTAGVAMAEQWQRQTCPTYGLNRALSVGVVCQQMQHPAILCGHRQGWSGHTLCIPVVKPSSRHLGLYVKLLEFCTG